MITSYGISEAGLIRPVNEDCILVGTRLFVLADGMGGYEGGQLASSTAVAAVKQYFDAHPDTVYSESAMREAVLLPTMPSCIRRSPPEPIRRWGLPSSLRQLPKITCIGHMWETAGFIYGMPAG